MGSLLYAHILRRAHEVRHTRPTTTTTTTRMLRRVVVVARLALQETKSAVFFLGEFRAIFNAAAALAVFKEYEGELGAFGRLRLLPFLSPCRRFISSGVGSEVGVAQFDDIENLQGTADVDWIRGWLARNVGNVQCGDTTAERGTHSQHACSSHVSWSMNRRRLCLLYFAYGLGTMGSGSGNRSQMFDRISS